MSRDIEQLDADRVWELVTIFAKDMKSRDAPLFTLEKRVRNFIVRVDDRRIERRSDDGTKQTGHITKRQIENLWTALIAERQVKGSSKWNYFALPLLQGALSDLVVNVGDGSIALIDHAPLSAPSPTSRPPPRYCYDESESQSRATTERFRDAVESRSSGEGATHWRLKHYIAQHPDRALTNLEGGPWREVQLELTLRVPTCDRVDVFMRDASGRPLMLEVKPVVTERDFHYYAQASKYRSIWRTLHDLDPGHVRCAIAAPRVPDALAEHMRARHQIESVTVEVPENYEPPPQTKP